MQEQHFYYNYSFALVIPYKHLMFLVFFISQYVNERFSYTNNTSLMIPKRKMLSQSWLFKVPIAKVSKE